MQDDYSCNSDDFQARASRFCMEVGLDNTRQSDDDENGKNDLDDDDEDDYSYNSVNF